MMILINGEPRSELNVTDRGFQYGDGLFETIEIFNGQLIFFQQHLTRLLLGCEKLLIPPPDNKLLQQEAQALAQNTAKGVLKIIITRGSGGRGYRLPETMQPTRVLSLHPFPDYPAEFQETGIVARICQQRLGLNPTLAGLKHLNRLEQILARAEWQTPDIQEGIMLDLNGFVIEGTMSNVFFVNHAQLYTPSLTQAGIAGIMRSFVLETAEKQGIAITQGFFTAQQLLDAEEVFVTNSVIGIWAVKQLEKRLFSVGNITRLMQAELLKFKQRD